MDIAQEKKALRRRMRMLRLVADQKQGPDAALALVHVFLPHLDDVGARPGTTIAGYWPIVTEIDVRPLLARLHERGLRCALPVIVDPAGPLAFRAWNPENGDLEPGDRETMHPPACHPQVRPDIVLVPTLACDAEGYRLGQGGGHYDRTLARLRRDGPVTAIGVIYAAQRIARVPREGNDQRLDWILSEDGLERVRP